MPRTHRLDRTLDKITQDVPPRALALQAIAEAVSYDDAAAYAADLIAGKCGSRRSLMKTVERSIINAAKGEKLELKIQRTRAAQFETMRLLKLASTVSSEVGLQMPEWVWMRVAFWSQLRVAQLTANSSGTGAVDQPEEELILAEAARTVEIGDRYVQTVTTTSLALGLVVERHLSGQTPLFAGQQRVLGEFERDANAAEGVVDLARKALGATSPVRTDRLKLASAQAETWERLGHAEALAWIGDSERALKVLTAKR